MLDLQGDEISCQPWSIQSQIPGLGVSHDCYSSIAHQIPQPVTRHHIGNLFTPPNLES